MRYLFARGLLFLTLLVMLSGCDAAVTQIDAKTNNSSTPSTGNSQSAPQWGLQVKASGCQANGPLQDKACTPGAIFPDATKEKICVPGYASAVRNVPVSVKNKVYSSYGIKTHRPGEYEVDHLVSLQLGGSNDISNLWPEAATPTPGFHEKDKVENWLHDQICKGAITLKDAQIKIATNWLTVYKSIPGQFNGSDSDDSA